MRAAPRRSSRLLDCFAVTLKIGKQHELPRRPGDWTTAKGKMNEVAENAADEAEEMKERFPEAGRTSSAAVPAKPEDAK